MTTALDAIPLRTADGGETSLGAHAGQVRLVVNVASKCGLTPQYAGLEALYRRYRDRGFTIVGLPANDFMGQEPGSDAEIQDFCSTTYDVTFPVLAKLKATGPDKAPIYAALTEAAPAPADAGGMRERLAGHGITPTEAPELLWNFEKFLVGRDGRVAARFAPDTAPDDPKLVGAIEAALAA